MSEIEFETVTIRVPKNIMALLRYEAGKDNETVEETIQYWLLDSTRGRIECLSGEALIPYMRFDRVFSELLGDKKYASKIVEVKTEQKAGI